jgi:hypothetical protein
LSFVAAVAMFEMMLKVDTSKNVFRTSECFLRTNFSYNSVKVQNWVSF